MKLLPLIFAATSLLASSAVAATISSTDQGWIDSNGRHGAGNTNIYTGHTGTRELRNFQVFDISGLSGHYSSATLTYAAGNGNYIADATETVTLYDVSTAPSRFFSDMFGSSGVAAYNDIGSGQVYGTATVRRPQGRMPAVSFTLNATGLAALNQAVSGNSQYFVIGAALTSNDGNDRLWSGSRRAPASSLEVVSGTPPTPAPVPLPAAGWALLAGLGALFGLRRANS